jgi:hypothetical protein
MQGGLLFVSVLAIALAAPAAADPPVVYVTPSAADTYPGIATLVRRAGDTATFAVRVRLGPEQRITDLGLSLSTATPQLADCDPGLLANPTLPLPGGPGVRWASVSSGPCAFAGSTSGTTAGVDASLWPFDPTYDLDSDSFFLGTYQLVANDFPGTIKEIFIGGSAAGTDGTGPLGALTFGPGDTAGANLLPDLQILNPVGDRLVGDYNDDGVVDAADYTIWRDSEGSVGMGLAADGNDDGRVDAADYDVWRGNFGTTAGGGGGAVAAVTSHDGGAPAITVVTQDATPAGSEAYLLQVATDPTGAVAVELALEGPFVDVLRLGRPLHRESRADANDGLDGYPKQEDTWVVDAVFDAPNPGANPFTGATTFGLAPRTAQGELFVSVGSGTTPGGAADLLRIVLPPGGEVSFRGTVARGGQAFPVSGTIPAPEADGVAAALAALALLVGRRARPTT